MSASDYKISAHFSFYELTQTNKSISLQALNREIAFNDKFIQANLAELAILLEKIRDIAGEPLFINSGFRCKELNAAIGGSKTSQHMLGQAADIHLASSSSNANAYKDLFLKIKGSGLSFGQLIWENPPGVSEWIHISTPHLSQNGQTLYFNGKSYSKI